MSKAIGYWLLCTVIAAFITSLEMDFDFKEKLKIFFLFSAFIALLEVAVMLMLGGWK